MNLANKQWYCLRSINIQLSSLSFGLKGDAATSYCLYATNVSCKTILLRHIVIYFQNIAFCHGHVCDSLCSDQIEADCLQLGGFATVDNVPVLRPARLRLSFSYCCSCLEGICLKPSLLSLAVLPVHSVHTHRDLHMSAVPTSTRSECSFEETQCSRLCQSQYCSDEVASTVTRTKT